MSSLSSTPAQNVPTHILLRPLCKFSKLRNPRKAFSHFLNCRNPIACRHSNPFGQRSVGFPHLLEKPLQHPSDINRRCRASWQHIGALRKQRLERIDIGDAICNCHTQLLWHHIKKGHELHQWPRVAVLSIDPTGVVVACVHNFGCKLAASTKVEHLNSQADAGDLANNLRTPPVATDRRQPEPERDHCCADSPYSRPSVPPHYAITFARRPARANGIPPAHSLIPCGLAGILPCHRGPRSTAMAVQMPAAAQVQHTARVLLTECQARRHGLGFRFTLNAAQRARTRTTAPTSLPAPPLAPAPPAQLELVA